MPLPPKPTTLGAILGSATSEVTESIQARDSFEHLADAGTETSETKQSPVKTKNATSKPAKKATRSNAKPKAKTDDEHSVDLALESQKRLEAKAVKVSTKTKGYRPKTRARKLFVLDTNVLMHDPLSLFQFEEHDVYLPMMTLEELDSHKKGMSDVARNARQVSRYLDQLLGHAKGNIADGVELNALGNTEARGKLFFQTQMIESTLPQGLPQGKADNQILAVVRALQAKEKEDRSVVLVSKDINMRIKATALGLAAEDYFTDKTLDDTDMLYSGRAQLPADFWETHGKKMQSWKEDGQTYYKITGPLVREWSVNLFVYLPDNSFMAQVKKIEGRTATLCVVRDYMQGNKHTVWGISARNREQCFALNLLMNPEIDFVTLLGQAGTGKTLITLAAALTQTLDMRRFSEIIFTRATVSVGEEIGFLPGTEEEKMLPWMGALEDNLEVLNHLDNSNDWNRNAANDLIRSRIKVKSMSFMRGRTFLNKFVIIDEAQNLSPKQMKTLITRAGPGTKIVCLGNIAQIDTPYLTEGSSGLTYVVDRFQGWEHAGHITLQRGERSRLADFASDVL